MNFRFGKERKKSAFSAVSSPGSLGELVQGYVNDQPFLINCPVDIFASASYHRLEPHTASSSHEHFPKAYRAANSVMNSYPYGVGSGNLVIKSSKALSCIRMPQTLSMF